MKPLDITIKADLINLNYLVRKLEDYIGNRIDSRTKFEVHLALEEAVTNIIKHGEAEEIHIQGHLDDKKFIIKISDTGKKFDPTLYDEPEINSRLKVRKPGGLGIYFMKHYMDEIKYQHKNYKNILTLIKYLK